jgi:hypothetical protein
MKKPVHSHPIGRPLEPGEWPDFILMEPDLRKRLKASPQLEQTWLGSRRKTGTKIEGVAMDVVMWVEADTTEFRAREAACEGHDPVTILDVLYAGILEPIYGEPYRPTRLLLDDPAMVENVRPYATALGMKVAYSPATEPMDKAFKRMKFLNRDHVNPN